MHFHAIIVVIPYNTTGIIKLCHTYLATQKNLNQQKLFNYLTLIHD